MNYEEKYKEALEKAKVYHNDYTKDIMEDIFPELEESEDEKIRKTLIQLFQSDNEESFGEFTNKQFVAWLEKQKDCIKLPNSAYTSNRDVIEFADKYSYNIWEKLMDKFKKNENYSIGCNDVSDIVLNAIINTYNWLEKQAEQDPITFNKAHIIDSALNDYCCKQYDALHKENGGVLSFARLQHLAMDIYGWCKKQGEQEKDILDDCIILNDNEDGLIAETIRYRNEKRGKQNICSDCINRKGCINCEDGNMKETMYDDDKLREAICE